MESTDQERYPLLTAAVMIGGFVLLYLSLFYPGFTPIHLTGGDAPTYLLNARRMLRGEVIYRDFFQFTPPATETFFFILFKIFGVHAWIPNLVLIVLGLLIAWVMIVISRTVISGKAAYLPAALFLVIPFRSRLDASHHWFSLLFAMAAVALLVQGISALRLVGAGALCGIAMCFTQSTGLPAIIGLALFLLWAAATHQLSWLNFRRAQLYIWFPFIIVIVLFNGYFIIRAGLGTFLHDTVVFGIRYWHYDFWNTFGAYMTDMPPYHPWYRLPALAIWFSVYLLTPLIYILFFVRYLDEKGERPSEPWDRLVLIALVGAMLFLGIAPAPFWMRLCVVAPPGIILFVWFLSSRGRFLTVRTTAAWVIVLVLAIGECGDRWVGWRQQVKLPIGRVVVYDRPLFQEITFLLDHTKPGDYFFGDADLSFLLDLRNPAPIPYVTASDYTRPEQVRQTIQALEKYPVKYVYWSSIFDMAPWVAGATNQLAPLRTYLTSHYYLAKSIEADDCDRSFWEIGTAPIELPPPPPPPAGQTGASPPGTNPQNPQRTPLDTPARVP